MTKTVHTTTHKHNTTKQIYGVRMLSRPQNQHAALGHQAWYSLALPLLALFDSDVIGDGDWLFVP